MANKDDRLPLIKRIFDPQMWLHDFVRITGCIPVFIDLRLKKIYENKKAKGYYSGKYVIVSNHSSFEDPVILHAVFWMRRVGYLVTEYLIKGKGKLFEYFFTKCSCMPIEKDNISYGVIKKAMNYMKRGHVMGIFPEGGINRQSEDMLKFKSGAAMVAAMSKADVVPVYIGRRKNRWHRQVVVMGEKIKIEDYVKGPMATMDEIQNLANALFEKEQELEKLYRAKYWREEK